MKQLVYAVNQKRALVTHNRVDFEELIQSYFAAEPKHYGVILATRRPPQEIVQR
jgi:hypothetical protein